MEIDGMIKYKQRVESRKWMDSVRDNIPSVQGFERKSSSMSERSGGSETRWTSRRGRKMGSSLRCEVERK